MKLRLKNVTRDYVTFPGFGHRVLSALTLGFYKGPGRFRALDGINLELGSDDESEGEIIGIIGPNGAGKSTLLQVLSGILGPGSGSMEFKGTVRSILELSVGFHPELTAKENLFYNGILWGYDSRELREGLEEILSFAELQDYGDLPIKGLSTGMQMRLGFALATFRRADLLLVDEALSVGDARFQQKSMARFHEFRALGSQILVVSHDINMLTAICDQLILMDQGRIVQMGKPVEVAQRYRKLIGERSISDNQIQKVSSEKVRTTLSCRDDKNNLRSHFQTGETIHLSIEFELTEPVEDLTCGIHLSDSIGVRVFGVNSKQLRVSLPCKKLIRLTYRLRVNLGSGLYSVGISLHRGLSHATDCLVWEENLFDLQIEHSPDLPFEGTGFLEPILKIED